MPKQTNPVSLITDNIDIWSSAIQNKKSVGRGSSKKINLYGIKKLRELILELALKGLLVEQSEVSAEDLIFDVKREKEIIRENHSIRKSQDSFPPSEIFVAPAHWRWASIGELAHVLGGKRVPRGYKLLDESTPYAYIRVTDMKEHSVNLDNLKFIDKSVHDQIAKYVINKEDVYITIAGTIGAVGIIPDELDGMHLTENASKLVLDGLNKGFLVRLLSCDYVQAQFQQAVNQMAQPKLSLNSIKSTSIAIPPLDEQNRIVTKVNELMTLCDQLEQQQENSITAHKTLVETLLAALTNAANKGDFEAAWKKIANHFDTLFTTEHSIDQLKQTILQLAVMGKLVPQNPNDEPASVLLEKIAAEKERLVKEKKIKKQKALPEISDEEKSLELPKGWEWCRLDNLSLRSEAGWSPRCIPTPRENNRWGVLKVSAVTWGVFNPDENKELPSSLEPRAQYEIRKGDFLISRANTAELVARAVVVPADAPKHLMMSDKIIRFVLSDNINGWFINLVNSSFFSRSYYASVAGGTSSSMKNVTREQIRNLVVPLPPAFEQVRIVAKVSKLIAVCEQLKLSLRQANTIQIKLADDINCQGRFHI